MGIAAVLTGVGSLVGAVGQFQGQEYAAQQAERAALVGKVQADQTNAAYREDLNSTIANIRAIRSSAGVGPGSPTEMAYIESQTKKSERDRQIDSGNKLMQAEQDKADAQFRRSAAGMALFGGAVSSLPYFFGS
jgi:sugar/nucleoside kinase (ribokinase family)